MIISNSSPVIALCSVDLLRLFKALFGEVFIPQEVFEEVVLNNQNQVYVQRTNQAIKEGYLKVRKPAKSMSFKRRLGSGEQGVLKLASEHVDTLRFVIIDDKKARKEAEDLGFIPGQTLVYTVELLRKAEELKLIDSYDEVMKKLNLKRNYLPG